MVTIETFHNQLPAFRTPGGEIFKKLQPLIEATEDALLSQLKPTYQPTENETTLLQRAAIMRTVYNEIPALDLVLTPTGFGIVSNQSTAPASPHRVEALRETIRRQATIAEDQLIASLLQHALQALKDPRLHCMHLITRPMQCHLYGITQPDGRPVYREEFSALVPKIYKAEMLVEKTISPELFETLLQHQYTAAPSNPQRAAALDTILHQARHFIAATLNHSTTAPEKRIMANRLLQTVRNFQSLLPEYQQTHTQQAQTAPRYENQSPDPSFFFS